MRYRIRHTTRYAYTEPVEIAWQLAHLCPTDRRGQVVRNARLQANPSPARTAEGVDHFGNRALWLYLDTPHEACTVTLEAEVDVAPAQVPAPSATGAWESVRETATRSTDPQIAEFRFASPHVPHDGQVEAYVAQSFPPGRNLLQALLDLTARLPRDLAFRPGATTIATPIAQVLQARAGVCQDFAHLVLSGLRAHGIPARYVSGYLRTRPPPGGIRRRGADASHAWIEAWLGPELGWLGLDPTNDLVAGDEHVVLAVGRDFSDVSPLRGVLLGGGAHGLSVAVDLEPLGP